MNYVASAIVVAALCCFWAGALLRFRCAHRRTAANHTVRLSGMLATIVVASGLPTLPSVLQSKQWFGLAGILAAIALFAWAWRSSRMRHFGVALAPDVPEGLVEHGAFAFVRHPFYVSYFLGWGCMPLLVGTVPAIAACASMVVQYAAAAVVEERMLRASNLASAHADYRSRVGMFVPRLVSKAPSLRSHRATESA